MVIQSGRHGLGAWLHGLGAAAMLIAGVTAFATRAIADSTDDTKADKTEKTQPSKSGAIVIGDDSIDPNQPIRPDFTINVSVNGEPDPSGNYKVDALGNVSIRYAGIMTPVSVKGMTPAQAQDAIASFLKTYIKNPLVKVTIMDTPRPTVFIGGAVHNTGAVIINNDTTLLDLLSRAEYTENSDLSQVKIIRKDQPAPIYVDFEKFIRSKRGEKVDESLNPVLKDKDRIWVNPRNTPSANGTISVFGEVPHPTPNVPLRSTAPLTVREVVNLAGGANPTADRHRVSIRRVGVDRPLIIDLDKAEQGDLVNNIELRADDTVYVEKLESNAYINMNGGFVKPGKLVYDKRTTLTQAISEVGGPAPYAKIRKGYISRHPDNDPKHSREIAFNYDEILKGKAPDIEMQAGDAVYIETGTPPRPALGPLDWLGALTQGSYLYNSLSGRRIY
jgi:protein involved in polysaccharide export with SLBB domain